MDREPVTDEVDLLIDALRGWKGLQMLPSNDVGGYFAPAGARLPLRLLTTDDLGWLKNPSKSDAHIFLILILWEIPPDLP